MERSYNMADNTVNNQKRGTNIQCDKATHEALNILGAWMIGKDNIHPELKDSIRISKPRIVKILAMEKIKELGLVKKSSEVATV